ncbi:MAG TPA: hypothetical protein VF498_03440 [Anaerolineales bacterium]
MREVLLLATTNGLAVCEREAGAWQETRRGLAGRQVTGVIAREGVILAGTRVGVFRSDDRGASWQEASAGLEIRHVRWLAYHPQVSDLEFAGTEPAGIFVSRDGARTWRACPEVSELRDRFHWYLPYSPQAGCIRGFAFHGQRAYAAAEVGGLLRSDDRGATWRLAAGSRGDPNDDPSPAEGRIYPDVHSVTVHPTSPDWVAAPTGGGFYRSDDGGQTWQVRYDCYCRAVWLDPNDPDHLVLGPADGVDRNGRIEETWDDGRTWVPASQGLAAPWPRHMVERFLAAGDELLAVLSNGELITTALAARPITWQRILPGAVEVLAAAVMAF